MKTPLDFMDNVLSVCMSVSMSSSLHVINQTVLQLQIGLVCVCVCMY